MAPEEPEVLDDPGIQQWLAGVKAHYGDLMHFNDAHTVRIMRQGLLEGLREHDRISRAIENEANRAEFDETFSDQNNQAKAGLELLDNWLAQRGLSP